MTIADYHALGRRGAYGSEQEIADYLGVARITAQTRRLKGRDWPPAYKFGKKVMYRWSEVEAWAESQRVGATKITK